MHSYLRTRTSCETPITRDEVSKHHKLQRSSSQLTRTEIVAPLTDAVDFVDGNSGQISSFVALVQLRQKHKCSQ